MFVRHFRPFHDFYFLYAACCCCCCYRRVCGTDFAMLKNEWREKNSNQNWCTVSALISSIRGLVAKRKRRDNIFSLSRFSPFTYSAPQRTHTHPQTHMHISNAQHIYVSFLLLLLVLFWLIQTMLICVRKRKACKILEKGYNISCISRFAFPTHFHCKRTLHSNSKQKVDAK